MPKTFTVPFSLVSKSDFTIKLPSTVSDPLVVALNFPFSFKLSIVKSPLTIAVPVSINLVTAFEFETYSKLPNVCLAFLI